MANLSKILKQLDKTWKEAEVREIGSTFWKPPEGNYTVKITDIVIELSKTSERLQIVYALEIADGEHKGKIFKKFDGLETTENLSWVKGTLELIGINLPIKISKLPETIESFYDDNPDGIYLDIKCSHDGEYANIYFNNLVDSGEIENDDIVKSEDSEENEEEEEEEDIENILEGMKLKDLLEYAKDNDITIKKSEKINAAKIRKTILASLES